MINKNTIKALFYFLIGIAVSACDGDNANQDKTDTLAFEGYHYKSHFLELAPNINMHYLDEGEGEGDPILLIHGIPTSSFLWRNIIPHLTNQGRVIAIDLINFGKSSKVDRYSLDDQAQYLGKFVEQLNLQNIRLVLHDYGGPVGLHFAQANPERISGLALFETAFAPFPSAELVPPNFPFQLMLGEDGRRIATQTDYWIGTVMANNQFNDKPEPNFEEKLILKNLSETEYLEYQSPYQTEEDKEMLYQFAFTVGFLDQPGDVLDDWLGIAEYISLASVPKLWLFATSGLISPEFTPIDPITGVPMSDPITGKNLSIKNTIEGNISAEAGGWVNPAKVIQLQTETKHFIQEDAPTELGETLSIWLNQNF